MRNQFMKKEMLDIFKRYLQEEEAPKTLSYYGLFNKEMGYGFFAGWQIAWMQQSLFLFANFILTSKTNVSLLKTDGAVLWEKA